MKRFQKKWVKPNIKHLKPTQWGWMVSFPEGLKIGEKVDIGAFTYINACFGVVLEDNVQIGGGCKLYSVDTISRKNGMIKMEKGSCLGANSVVLGNVTIGKYATVGALSFVNRDIPANEVWGGSPIKKIK